MVKVAVILSGCGYLDGAEIRESVIALLELDKADADVTIFAPDIPQVHVVNHVTSEITKDIRNVLEESARIARGEIKPLMEAEEKDFDALVLPGGFGVAKNLSDLAFRGGDTVVFPKFESLIQDFMAAGKPIGAICIAPAVLAAAAEEGTYPNVTIGEDPNELIKKFGGVHKDCPTDKAITDKKNNIFSCSAYMRDDARLKDVAAGIEKVIALTLEAAQSKKEAA